MLCINKTKLHYISTGQGTRGVRTKQKCVTIYLHSFTYTRREELLQRRDGKWYRAKSCACLRSIVLTCWTDAKLIKPTTN